MLLFVSFSAFSNSIKLNENVLLENEKNVNFYDLDLFEISELKVLNKSSLNLTGFNSETANNVVFARSRCRKVYVDTYNDAYKNTANPIAAAVAAGAAYTACLILSDGATNKSNNVQ